MKRNKHIITAFKLRALHAAFAVLLTASAAYAQGTRTKKTAPTKTEQSIERQGMTKICDTDSTILVSLMYTRADNFTGRI